MTRIEKFIALILYILWSIIFFLFIIQIVSYCLFFLSVEIAIDNGGIDF